MKQRVLAVMAALAVLLCACGAGTQDGGAVDVRDLAAVEEAYVRPLGLTTVIGMPWAEPSELNADSVLTVYMIHVLDDPALVQEYYDGATGEYHFPEDAVEEYTSQVFGMSADMTRESSGYDGEFYNVPEGLGGAWGVEVTGAESSEDGQLLDIEYRLIDAQDEVSALGALTVQLLLDGTYRYLGNVQWEPGE